MVFDSPVLREIMQPLDKIQEHIVQCLLTITNDYLAHDQTLVVFCNNPLKYIICALFLQTLNHSTKWPLQFYTEIIPANQETWPLHGSYIFIQDSENIWPPVEELKEMPGWNPRAKFVVALLNNRHVDDTNERIFADFWHENAVNVVVISPAKYENHRGELLEALDLFSWFPYALQSHCGDVIDVTLLDRWLVQDNGFLYGNNLFPPKISDNFQGCAITASAFPFGIMVTDPVINGTNITYADGYEIRLFNVFLESLNLTPRFVLPPSKILMWGGFENGTWTGLIGDVIYKRVDVAFGGIMSDNLQFSRETVVTVPHTVTGIWWYVPCAKPISGWTSISRVFKLSLWLLFLVIYMMVSLIVCFLSISSSANEIIAYTSISVCLLNLWAIILGTSVSNEVPSRAHVRILVLAWVVFSYSVNTVYQSFLTSYLIDPGLGKQISSEEEIFESGIDFGYHPITQLILGDLLGERYKRRQICYEMIPCIDRIAYQGNMAVFIVKLLADHMLAVRYTNAEGKPLLCNVDDMFASIYYSMLLQKGSFYVEEFNKIILRMNEAGILQFWIRNLFYVDTLKSVKKGDPKSEEYIVLELKHFLSVIVLLILGYIFSVFTFLCEILSKTKFFKYLYHKYISRRINEK